MSIVLVAFPSAPKPTAEAVETETKLDSYIEERTLGNPAVARISH